MLAARSLPPRQQNAAIFWGAGAAVVMRIVLTVIAVEMLKWPWLKLVGAVLLLWIAVKLLLPEHKGDSDVESGVLRILASTCEGDGIGTGSGSGEGWWWAWTTWPGLPCT